VCLFWKLVSSKAEWKYSSLSPLCLGTVRCQVWSAFPFPKFMNRCSAPLFTFSFEIRGSNFQGHPKAFRRCYKFVNTSSTARFTWLKREIFIWTRATVLLLRRTAFDYCCTELYYNTVPGSTYGTRSSGWQVYRSSFSGMNYMRVLARVVPRDETVWASKNTPIVLNLLAKRQI